MIPGADEFDLDLQIDADQVDRLLRVDPTDVGPPDELTFARNAFFPVTTGPRYTCSYCTFVDPPGEATLMSPASIRETARRGADAGCTEALFTFGDDPDERYDEIHAQLSAWSHDSIHDYLREAAHIALEEGLLPHANPGDQTPAQMAAKADLMASMGVMLETTADVPAHAGPRGKSPGQRLATIRTAGELSVPFTTGILVGIGETTRDRAESLLAIRELHARYGHVQEVIVQPVTENERWRGGSPDLETLRRTVAMGRVALPEEVSVQVPPNLAPVREIVDAGMDDLGGISPVTTDHVNPEDDWPEMAEIRAIADAVDIPVRERLPVAERFLPTTGLANEWVSERVGRAIRSDTAAGRRFRAVLDGHPFVDDVA
ncbi:7,8-didemethyl-8-hydroxy-5-deazariboflavin synthase subunit CofG [Halanaeroarchaeum sulfurireducens]|uniref:7,8-didemethyl-8-hydroxy-5-deazariboflavin synthase n=1 Tax=Halanaeroarchaeum sulfurireducens TaxID=1604004 RepID=A0A0N9N720_9EURY|nr:7,8-didemethyl-8-hydroxy-5-deazariboflavin synthase subunit CofG [Halanaeroarchaeum sulfurireducens]ALG82813.1 7,8-didemethyl-8-hydroxy-5-deazariboflavin synthase subunit 1 [Halanaeroarchaeum sulfurireducens]